MGRIYEGMKLDYSDGSSWRLFCLDNPKARLIRIDTTKIEFQTLLVSDINEGFLTGNIKCSAEEPLVVDRNKLSDEKVRKLDDNLAFVRNAESIFGRDFAGFASKEGCKEFRELYEKTGFSKKKAFQLVRKWLQSGKIEASLIDERIYGNAKGLHQFKVPTGASASKIVLTQEIYDIFDEGIEYFKKIRLAKCKDAYDQILLVHFTKQEDGHLVLAPTDEIPTYKQFYNYVHRKLHQSDIERIKTSNREYRNNCRLIADTPRSDTLCPGMIVEVDALEVDLEIVSSDIRSDNIGRPIVYAMVDVYSHAIVAFTVGLDNNSNLGLDGLMINLFEDKQEFLTRYGISDYDEGLWPSCFVPGEIRCDNGPDLKSKQFEEACRILGVIKTNEPPATGSYKGLIEQIFRQFHKKIKADLEDKGVIQKRYDSTHYKDACLTLREMVLLFINFVFWYNGHYIQDFNLTNDMVLSGVKKTPESVWKYGVEHFGNPKSITLANRSAHYFAIMPEVKAAISREGILYKGLVYSVENDADLITKMKLAKQNAGKRDVNGTLLNEIRVRMDPSNIMTLFYEKDGKICLLNLNKARSPERNAMTWSEYLERHDAVKRIDKEGKKLNQINDLTSKSNVQNIGNSVQDKAETTTMSEIRDNRKREKLKDNLENSISNKIISSMDAASKSNSLLPAKESDESITEIVQDNTAENEVPKKNKPVLLTDECPEDLFDI